MKWSNALIEAFTDPNVAETAAPHGMFFVRMRSLVKEAENAREKANALS